MAKKRNAKNVQQNATRSLLMSGLIVAAITGVTPAMAATVTVDNTSTGAWASVSGGTLDAASDVVTQAGAILYTDGTPDTVNSLHVQYAEFYVGTAGLKVSGGNVSNAVGTARVVVGDSGKLYVGKNFVSGSTTVSGGSLTADNMSINGDNALVAVSKAQTLTLTSGDLNIVNGTLALVNGTVKIASGDLNIESKGTLYASGAIGNIVDASKAVNLHGGTITVAQGSGLTFGSVSGDYATHLGNMGTGATSGVLIIQESKKFVSTGGTIKAHTVVTGSGSEAKFSDGTTTVDNLTIQSGGVSIIEGGAIVDVATKEVTVDGAGSKLEMKGGTLNIANGTGTLIAQNSGEFAATAGVNTLNGSVSLISNGKLTVSGTDTDLTITKNLTVDGGSANVGAGSSLNVNQNLVINNGTVTIGGNLNVDGTTSAKSAGKLDITGNGIAAITGASLLNKDQSLNSGNYAGQLSVSASGGLILTGITAQTITLEQYNAIVDRIASLSGGGTAVTKDNLALMGVKVTGLDVSGNGTGTRVTGNDLLLTSGNNNTISGTYFAPTVQLQSGSSMTVGDASGGSLTLAGNTTGGELVRTANGAPVALTVASAGTLNVGFDGITTNGTLGILTTSGTVNVATGTTLSITQTTITDGTLSVIGSTAAPTNVDLGTLTATGGTIFIDPAYVTAQLAGNKDFGAELLLGNDGQMNIGKNDGWMQKQLQLAHYDGSGGALGLRQQLRMAGDAKIIVDRNLTLDGKNTGSTDFDVTTDAGSYFGSGSLLVVEGNVAADVNGAISFTGISNNINSTDRNITINDSAKLRISNGLGNTTYTIVSGANVIASGAAGTGWNGANLTTDSDMLAGRTSFTNTNGTITTRFDVRDASNVYANIDGEMAGMINNLYNSKLNGDANNSNRGLAFLTRATRGEYLDNSETARVVEGAARMGAIAGVQTMTMTAATAGTSAAAARTSMASPLMSQTPKALALNDDGSWTPEGVSAGDSGRTGVGLWIMPLYQSANKWGMKAGEFKTGISGDLGGVAIGADYTIDEAIRIGLSLNMGGGYAQSKGDFSSTDNNFNFWGINLYGGWTHNNFGLTADLGYTSSFNDVKQDLPSSLQMSELKADITSSAFTAGLRGEYKFETEVVDIIPHVGVRFMSLDTYEFDTKSSGTVFKNEQSLQNIWTFPIGVTFAKDITNESGWNFKPQVDLQIIPAAGDVKAKSKVKIAGLGSTAELNTRIMDDVSFGGGVGLNLQKDNISFGINYNVLMGEHSTDHGVYGTFRYEF